MKTSEIIMTLKKDLDNGNKAAINKFWDMVKIMGSPLVEGIKDDKEHVLITFIWKGAPDLESVSVFGPYPDGDIRQNQLQRLNKTNVWYKSYIAKNNVLSSYFYSLNDNYGDNWEERWRNLKSDPFNPKTFVFPKNEEIPNGITKKASILELPLTDPQPWVKEIKNGKKGNITKQRCVSKLLDNERNLWIYTPHGYDKNSSYPLVILFDGDMYNGAIPTPTILDNLISDKRIPPVVAILIDNPQRDIELPCNDEFVKFLTDELLPTIRHEYRITDDPSKIVVGGSSYGGLAATYAEFKRPDIFGNVLSQSGSFWWKPSEDYEGYWLVKQFEVEPTQPLNFYLDVGVYEIEKMTQSNKAMFNVLRDKGYRVHYDEFSGGHDYLCWRGTLANGLITILGLE
jgi:enterochelin esterase-like enzyme